MTIQLINCYQFILIIVFDKNTQQNLKKYIGIKDRRHVDKFLNESNSKLIKTRKINKMKYYLFIFPMIFGFVFQFKFFFFLFFLIT